MTVINCATSVRCDYYFRFAVWLFAQGRDVLVYDYRGIGGSRPARLAKLRANWLDWGRLDCEAALRARDAFPGQPIGVVALRIGGFALETAASNVHVRHAVTVGAVCWRDYRPAERRRMWWKWRRDAGARGRVRLRAREARLDGRYAARLAFVGALAGALRGGLYERPARRTRREPRRVARPFAGLSAPMLAIGLDDDGFGTVEAIERLVGYYTGSDVTHLRIAPADIGVDAIGHSRFSHRFTETLWPLALYWLQHGALPADAPGYVHAIHPASRGRGPAAACRALPRTGDRAASSCLAHAEGHAPALGIDAGGPQVRHIA